VRFRYVIGPDGTVDMADRGLAYGDGLFETMAISHGQIRHYPLHRDRLVSGCSRLGLPIPGAEELETAIRSTTAGIERGSLKLILTRGSGPRGYAPPQDPAPVLLLTAQASTDRPAPHISVVRLRQQLAESETLAGIKHLCRLEQVLGQQELGQRDADEGLMLSTRGNVVGGTSRNLFAVLNGKLVTPDLSRSGILGVMRRAVIARCAELGISCVERDILPDELAAADELFMTNALVGIQSVIALDAVTFAPGPLSARLRAEPGFSC
jgi:4-amino-4-deoxychorismate lyase